MPDGRYWLHTLGCPKNDVDSDKLAGVLQAEGYLPAPGPGVADLVVVNTCAFIEAARQESIDAILELADVRRDGARLVVTGCMAERYGEELAAALPEVDLVAGFGQPVTGAAVDHTRHGSGGRDGRDGPVGHDPDGRSGALVALGPRRDRRLHAGSFDLLTLPRPPTATPWAYVKVAEGCDRICGFCAIPSFRGKQRSRPVDDVLAEVEALAASATLPVREVVLVAQDLASYGRDRSRRSGRHAPGRAGAVLPARAEPMAPGGPTPLVSLVRAMGELVARTRLLYLYPSGLTDELVETIIGTGVPYFDLSLQHVSRPLLASMRRWGDGQRFLDRIAAIRQAAPEATFRSSFIVGYPGETEADHDLLLEFLGEAELDWAGFFPFSREEGTHAAALAGQVPTPLVLERLRECTELQDAVTARRRDALVGQVRQVLVDAPGAGRTAHEAPEIDGVVRVPASLPMGALVDVELTASLGTDLVGSPVASRGQVAGGPL